MRYVTLPYVRPFCVADLIPREDPSVVQIVLMNGGMSFSVLAKNYLRHYSYKKKSLEKEKLRYF